MAPVGIAIVGSGIFVREEHLPAVLQDSSTIVFKAIYSRSKASAELVLSDKPEVKVDIYSDDSPLGSNLDDLLKRDDIEAVIIALPIVAQPEYVKKALLAGKHVLSEKPIAKDLDSANELIRWKSQNAPNLNWSVAENYRFQEGLQYARQQVESLGRVTHFRVQMHSLIKPGGKYFETAWRKVPDYQGGFLLDGGVHFTAGTQILLGEGNVRSLVAFTQLVQPHLPPLDSVASVWTLQDGTIGTFTVSFGQAGLGSHEFLILCEEGMVKVGGVHTDQVRQGPHIVTVTKNGMQPEERIFERDRSGVMGEVKAFAESVAAGKRDQRQTPEAGLRDLELIEKMLLSGQNQGKLYDITGGGEEGLIKNIAKILEGGL